MLKANRFLLFLISLALASCAVEPLPSPTQVTQIGREQAVSAAEAACNTGHLVPLEPPRLLEARLMARAQAEAVLQGTGSPSEPPPLPPGGDSTPVWLVVLEGRWRLIPPFDPRPTPSASPTPMITTTCYRIIDASSGNDLP